jgi:glycosyltransferase involved in cell wall biosynthesis
MMKIIILSTPDTRESQSMPRFAEMLGEGMKNRGHNVEYWTSGSTMIDLMGPLSEPLRKWAGYADDFLIYPSILLRKISLLSRDHLVVVADQGLGMWVPEIRTRPHVVHCHDLLAIRSSVGEFPENRLSLTGRLYQSRISSGLSKARNFISVSDATRNSLHSVLGIPAGISEVVPNALNRPLSPMSLEVASACLGMPVPLPKERPIIHVGGNQWYKNREGVLEIYAAYAATEAEPAPLWMIGREPTPSLRLLARMVPSSGRVCFMTDISDSKLAAIYSLAALLLFPSLEEGFGWPVAEAMACGCPVITTGIAPMTEVGGDAVVYVPRAGPSFQRREWAASCARILSDTISLPEDLKTEMIMRGLDQATLFKSDDFLNRCEFIYREILSRKS